MYVHQTIEAIEAARRTNRVTVKALAEKAGFDRTRLATVLNGITPDELANLKRAAKELGMRIPRHG